MITLVSGIPRSGLSLMMQMLEAGGLPVFTDHSRPADEHNPRGYYDCQAADRLPDDNAWLKDAEGKACKILSHLLPYLPARHEYRVIFMLRDLDEVMASQAAMPERGHTDNDVHPEMVRHHYEQHLRRIRRWLDAPRRTAVLYCRYPYAVAEPMTVARNVETFLGLRMNLHAMATAVDRRLYRQQAAGENPDSA